MSSPVYGSVEIDVGNTVQIPAEIYQMITKLNPISVFTKIQLCNLLLMETRI